MQLIRLRLKGFTGIKKGMDLDEIEIDFSNTSGLIAFTGPNGNGKTTILDSMHPFRTMPSRKRSLQHHVFLRDSEKELEFNFNGDRYRSLIKIDAGSDRTEGFLWKNGESLVDGKVTNYDQEIIKLCGSPALFFNSVFCAQNSEKLNEMTTGDLKKLFSEFLRLDQLIDWESTSKQCAAILGNKLDALELRIDQLTQTTRDKEDVLIKLASFTTQSEMANAKLLKLSEELSIKDAELHDTQAAIQKNSILRDRKAELKTESMQIEQATTTFQENFKLEVSKNNSEKRDAEIEIMGQDRLLANEKEIRDAVKRVSELTVEIEKLSERGATERSREEKLRGEYDAMCKTAGGAASYLLKFQTETRDTAVRIGNDIKICKTRMVELEKKDPECTSTTCSFIVGALEAERGLPELEKSLAEWQANRSSREEEYKRESEQLKADCGELWTQTETVAANIKRMKTVYRTFRAELKAIQPLASDLSKVEIATQRRADLVKRQEELKEREMQIRTAANCKFEELRQTGAAIDEKLYDVLKQIDNDADKKVLGIRKSSDELTVTIKAYSNSILPDLKADIETFSRRREEIEAAESEWEKAKVLADTYLYEISDWTYLKNACSKDGLRALEIDSVAPVVTGYANELLTSTFGPSSTVRFRTQDPETGREVLDILVIREDGSEVLLDNLSGGEKVWNLKALALGLTLVSKEKSGTNYLSAMADEEDGSLDVENARNFVSLYRSFMPIGRFEDLYFISHKPECVAMADHVISLSGTGIEID